jgi:hypothetical protein
MIMRDGPWVVNVLEIDLGKAGLDVRSVHAHDRVRGRETTSSIASRMSDSLRLCVAAMNADFFHKDGETVNTQITEGEFVRAAQPHLSDSGTVLLPRSQIGLTWDAKPLIERFVFTGTVLWPDAGVSNLASVNVVDDRGFVLFNSYWGMRTPEDSLQDAIIEIGLHREQEHGDTLVCVVTGPLGTGGGLAIPSDGIVLTAYHDSLWPGDRTLSFGDTVKVVTRMEPGLGEIRTLVGGTPRIVVDGESVAGKEEFMERTIRSFSVKRHPRTGIAFSSDSTALFFITVDGRQDASVGMTLPEFADLMIVLGAYQGLNLDGGGSTAMVVDGHLVNRPSDPTGERPVGNCLVLQTGRSPE